MVTIHDLTFYLFPDLHLTLKKIYFKFFIFLSVYRVDVIICVSESTKNDLNKLFPKSKIKSIVIPLGKDERFIPTLSKKDIIKTLEKYQIDSDYILFIGTLEPRKNLISLINAFKKVQLNGFNNYKLVIAGRKGWFYKPIFEIVKRNNLEKQVIFTGFIDEHDKPFLISGAKIFVYPSKYEGFGIPVLEALSCGIPTITSNISSMPEVAGDAALLINPESETELTNAICSLLTDNDLQQVLRKKAIIQSNKYTWEITAKETLKAYSL